MPGTGRFCVLVALLFVALTSLVPSASASTPAKGTVKVTTFCDGDIHMQASRWPSGFGHYFDLSIDGMSIGQGGFGSSYDNTQNEWTVDGRTHSWVVQIEQYDPSTESISVVGTYRGSHGPCNSLAAGRSISGKGAIWNNAPSEGTPLYSPPLHLFAASNCAVVLKLEAGRTAWHTKPAGAGKGCRLLMLRSGDLALYTRSNQRVWHSNTAGKHGARLVLTARGNAEIVTAKNTVVWQTRTHAR